MPTACCAHVLCWVTFGIWRLMVRPTSLGIKRDPNWCLFSSNDKSAMFFGSNSPVGTCLPLHFVDLSSPKGKMVAHSKLLQAVSVHCPEQEVHTWSELGLHIGNIASSQQSTFWMTLIITVLGAFSPSNFLCGKFESMLTVTWPLLPYIL